MSSGPATSAFISGLEECRGLWLPTADAQSIPRVPATSLSPETFFSTWVATNRPCVITGALESWPALAAWAAGPAAMLQSCGGVGDSRVTVAMTPNGWGDAPTRVVAREDGTWVPSEAAQRTSSGGARCCCTHVGRAAEGAGKEELWFVRPEERPMSLASAIECVQQSTHGKRCYLSAQVRGV